MERAAELYRAALDADGPLEGVSIVAERCEEVENRLADTKPSDGKVN